MTGILKQTLLKMGLYHRAKFGFPGRIYALLFKSNQNRQNLREFHFYHSFLSDPDLIFDIGANDGHKTIVFAAMAKQVIACDPDPFNQDVLKLRFRYKKNVFVEPLAVADKEGISDLYVHQPGSALNTLNPVWKAILEKRNIGRWKEHVLFSGITIAVRTTTLDALIVKYGKPDMIKIDVEGYEKMVLMGLTSPIDHISFEVLLPEFMEESLDCIYRLISLNANYRFNYAQEEKLMLPHFILPSEFIYVLQGLNTPHIEVIAKIEKMPG